AREHSRRCLQHRTKRRSLRCRRRLALCWRANISPSRMADPGKPDLDCKLRALFHGRFPARAPARERCELLFHLDHFPLLTKNSLIRACPRKTIFAFVGSFVANFVDRDRSKAWDFDKASDKGSRETFLGQALIN